MEESLKIKIGADIVEVTKSLNELEKEFKDLSKAVKSATGSEFTKLNRELGKVSQTIQRVKGLGRDGFDEFGQKLKPLPVELSKIDRSGAGATQALTNFNRVIQDAPFGIIGIANNIDPLVESFQRLKRESGSTNLAIKSLFGALAGPTGILFAFSALTTVGTVLVQRYGSLGNAFRVLTGQTKELSKAQKEAQEASEANAKSIANELGAEITRVNTLINAIKAETTTKAERKAAVEELKKINPEYFGALEKETDLVRSLSVAYSGYVNSLKAAFASKAIEKELERLFARKLEIEIELDQQAQNDLKTAQGRVTDAITSEENKRLQEILQKNLLDLTEQERRFLQSIQRRTVGTRQFNLDNTLQKELAALNKSIDQLLLKQSQLGNFNIDLPPNKKDKDDLAEYLRMLDKLEARVNNAQVGRIGAGGTGGAFTSIIGVIDGQLVGGVARVSQGIDILDQNFKELGQTLRSGINTDLALDGAVEGSQRLENLNKTAVNVKKTFEDTTGVVNALGNLFSQTFEAALINGQNFIQSFVNGLKQLIARLIAAAAAAAVLAAILSASGGGGFIGTFKNLFSNFSGFKIGAAAPGIQTGSAGIFSAPSINGQSPINLNLNAEIEGSKIRLVLDRANNSLRING